MKKLKKLGKNSIIDIMPGVKFGEEIECTCDFDDCETSCETGCNYYSGGQYQGHYISAQGHDNHLRDLKIPRET